MTTTKQSIVSKRQLGKAMLISIAIALIVLFTAVLPAEYNMDPLGTGKLFGFTKLYVADTVKSEENPILKEEIPVLKRKVLILENVGSKADVAMPVEANNPPPKVQLALREDTIKVTVAKGKGIEYKVNMLKYGKAKYDWITDEGIVYTDFHGEVKQKNAPKNVFYESYTLGYSNNMAGTLTAPFEGKHGWYFRNKTQKDIVVTLHIKGEYALRE